MLSTNRAFRSTALLSGSMLPTVPTNTAAGAQLVVEHLADHGHRQIDVTGPLLDTQIDHRLRGSMKGCFASADYL